MNKLLKVLAISGIACRMSYYAYVDFPETKVHGDAHIVNLSKNYRDADVTFYTNYIHIKNKESDVYTSAGTQVVVYRGEVQDD